MRNRIQGTSHRRHILPCRGWGRRPEPTVDPNGSESDQLNGQPALSFFWCAFLLCPAQFQQITVKRMPVYKANCPLAARGFQFDRKKDILADQFVNVAA